MPFPCFFPVIQSSWRLPGWICAWNRIPVFYGGSMHKITEALLSWYDRCARDLPWRKMNDPYRTWVSEAMLQQTRVDTVLPYYDRFLSRFPTLDSLAEASEDEVLKLWQGLGYYSRARNLYKGARQIVSSFSGSIPSDPALLTKISGIGPYTAGAIASIAFGIPVPAVDGNVIRVYTRVFGIRVNPVLPENRRRINSLAASLVPTDRPGDYNQSVMDLGATICIPGTPDCDRCPLTAFCDAYKKGDAADLPCLPKSSPVRIITYTVPVICSSGRILVRRRTEKLLQGLWCFPMLEGALKEPEIRCTVFTRWHLTLDSIVHRENCRHVFTHQIWQMSLWTAEAPPKAPVPDGFSFVPAVDLPSLAFPTAMKAPLRLAVKA